MKTEIVRPAKPNTCCTCMNLSRTGTAGETTLGSASASAIPSCSFVLTSWSREFAKGPAEVAAEALDRNSDMQLEELREATGKAQERRFG